MCSDEKKKNKLPFMTDWWMIWFGMEMKILTSQSSNLYSFGFSKRHSCSDHLISAESLIATIISAANELRSFLIFGDCPKSLACHTKKHLKHLIRFGNSYMKLKAVVKTWSLDLIGRQSSHISYAITLTWTVLICADCKWNKLASEYSNFSTGNKP